MYSNGMVTIYNKSCLDMSDIPGESIQTVVTSPPYWGLRDYGTEPLIWGEKEGCKHTWGDTLPRAGYRSSDGSPGPKQSKGSYGRDNDNGSQFCQLCGAWKGCLGLEPTPELYVENILEIFREVKRVLRDDGIVWLNLGDTYNSGRNGGWAGGKHGISKPENAPRQSGTNVPGLKPKDLIGIPWRFAFALQGFAVVPFKSFSVWAEDLRLARENRDWEAVKIIEDKLRRMDLLSRFISDGWYLRCDIIWSKPNPMPESVRDRPTRAHEYIFLLSKSARYYYDADAIRDPVAESTIGRGPVSFGGEKGRNYQPDKSDPNYRNGSEQWGRTFDYQASCKKIKVPSGWDTAEGAYGTIHRDGRGEPEYQDYVEMPGRNKRTVWTIATQPYPEAHFATFPEALIEPCILAGSRSGDTVLDPFLGSGTTAWVAQRLGRRCIGYELSAEYCELAVKRNQQVGMVL